MRIKKVDYNFTTDTQTEKPNTKFYKNGFEYKIYVYGNSIKVEKEEEKTEKFEIEYFEIVD